MRSSERGSLTRGLVFQAGLVLSVVVWGTLSLATAPLPYRWRYWFVSRWCSWMELWLRIAAGITHEIEGFEHVRGQPGVVMAKHQSTWETVSLVRWFYPQTWVLKRELIWLPLFGWALGLLEPIAIDRRAGRDAVRQVVDQGCQRLAAGRWVVVFPEGTRVPAGQKGRYRMGGAVLACRAGVPVIPVAHNAGEHWPRDGIRIRPGHIRVQIGEPIDTQGKTPDEVSREVESWIEQRMPSLSRLGYPGTVFDRRKQAHGRR